MQEAKVNLGVPQTILGWQDHRTNDNNQHGALLLPMYSFWQNPMLVLPTTPPLIMTKK